MSGRQIISVDGIDGSGKSYFARSLGAAFASAGRPSLLVSIDDFRRPVQWQSQDRGEAEVFYEDYFDFERLDACVRSFRAGTTSFKVPHFDSMLDRVVGESILDFTENPIFIVEGVFAGRLEASRDCFRFYLETDWRVARTRLVNRETSKGRPLSEVERRIEVRYSPAQLRYRTDFSPEETAHVLIDNQDIHRARTLRADLAPLPQELRPLVEGILP